VYPSLPKAKRAFPDEGHGSLKKEGCRYGVPMKLPLVEGIDQYDWQKLDYLCRENQQD
jgi:hypothetical protein